MKRCENEGGGEGGENDAIMTKNNRNKCDALRLKRG